MTTKLPTKAQVVADLKEWLPLNWLSNTVEQQIENVADALVRAGLAEEPREEGWYWVRWFTEPLSQWCVRHWNGIGWATNHGGREDGDSPSIVGPRILPPKE